MKANRIYSAIIVILVLAIPSMGQSKVKFPFKGQITGDNVNVRSGPDINYYSTIRLMRGNVVEVVGQEYGWYKIVAPDGSFSWVAKDYVDKVDDKKGVINRNRVAIRAGSKFTDKKTAIQMIAKQGMSITIIGQQGEYYKIVPPEGAYLWISADYVQPVVEKKSVPIKKIKTEIEKIQKVVTTTTAPVATRAAKEIEKPETEEGIFGKYGKQIAELDKLYKAELAKPLMERQFGRIIEGFKTIAKQKQIPIAAAYALQRLELIDYQLQAQKGYHQLQQIQKQFEEQSRKIEEQKAQTELEKMKPPRLYKSAGILRRSNIFTGPLMPKRYRLVEPDREHTIAYVELAKNAKINIADFMGRYVGVYGSVKYDPKLRINIITATAFKILNRPITTQPAGKK